MNKLYLYTFLLLLTACSSPKKTASKDNVSDLKFTVAEAPEWTQLFLRTNGWYGGDGIFAIPLNGKENAAPKDNSKNLILFSDSMIGGDIENGKPKDGGTMVHNTVALFNGSVPGNDKITFYNGVLPSDSSTAIFNPKTSSTQQGDYYWLGDGFVNTAKNSDIYVFAYKMHNKSQTDDWSFYNTKTVLINIPYYSKPPYTDQKQIETPLRFPDDAGTFGAGIFVNTQSAKTPKPDGFVYVYGVTNKNKALVAARVFPQDIEDFSKWTFWNGTNWTTDMSQSAEITTGISNEMSISPLPDGRYILVSMIDGMSRSVGIKIGSSPIGPFGEFKTIYTCKEPLENKHYFTYNAKAHPSLSQPGELLISYNVNAFEFVKEIKDNPNLYRPRFIKLKFQE